jgi:hypothetical protein
MAKPATYGVLFTDSGVIYDNASIPGTTVRDLRGLVQTPTEAVLVSGIDGRLGGTVQVTLTAARVVGLPLNRVAGRRYRFEFIQGGAGGFAVTWNAAYKKTWSDVGNVTGARSSIEFEDDGVNLNQVGAQAPYV